MADRLRNRVDSVVREHLAAYVAKTDVIADVDSVRRAYVRRIVGAAINDLNFFDEVVQVGPPDEWDPERIQEYVGGYSDLYDRYPLT